MPLEIGVDCVKVADLERKLTDRLMKKVFTDAERAYCSVKARPAVHFAGKFAAKEAARKALFAGGIDLSIFNIEVVSDERGLPHLNLKGNDGLNDRMKVSISHTDEVAIAFVTFEPR